MAEARIQLRRGTASEWTSANPVLAAGEIGFETNTGQFKIGNGSTAWTSLSYSTPSLTGTSPITYSNGTISINQSLITIAQSQVTDLTTDLAAKASTAYVDNGLSGKLDTNGNAATATTATNIAGGSAGKVVYQTGSGSTDFTAVGTAGQVLTSNGTSAPTWSAPAASGFNAFMLAGM